MSETLKAKRLPLGNQTFAKIIKENLLYADKTKFIHDLIQSSENNYFLSRPRRFGKTLLLDTIKEVFSGNSELFKDLWIGQSGYGFPKHPVLTLTMSTSSESPEILKANLLNQLRRKAGKADLTIDAQTPDTYFEELIQALHKKTGPKIDSGIVVLIDEYDAPVTRNMDNLKVAQANAKILHDFFAVLKTNESMESIRFTFVTGITRYALTSMDSGANHLNDISLDARYSGICGFSVDEFESLFADLLAPTLEKLKENGRFKPSAGISNLLNKIKKWYDGYNWGGETRVLNPYSILKFFQNCSFSNYWIQSGRPVHLTALIEANPADFIMPEYKPKTSTAIRKSELTQLEALPVLFHSGYLTIDKIASVHANEADITESEPEEYFTFKYPNYEISSSYLKDVYTIVFHQKSFFLLTHGKDIRKALLARDAAAIETIFSNYLAAISYHERPTTEKTFHAYMHLILSVSGFKVRSQLPGAEARLDLLVELADRVYVIIELKVQQKPTKKFTQAERAVLAFQARLKLPKTTVDKHLAMSSLSYQYWQDIDKALSESGDKPLAEADKIRLIANTIVSLAPKDKIDNELAKLAVNSIAPEYIQEALSEASVGPELTSDRLDELLAKRAETALEDITNRKYHQVTGSEAKEIIYLGMAIYGHGTEVKAVFGPK